ncbi:glycosyltransferase 61 family protein [Teichococcus deserti]|uniref:glycosyltransferase 61 family protein n=1 Tax=Teichococcus deserti TaxID=1817963 RepID=UPI000975B990|nr:glycosyltransferase 61 family protein [Pseudoroseomonas deserti]
MENTDFVSHDTGLYGGTIYAHFGHFILDSLSRIYPALSSSKRIEGRIFFHAQPLDGGSDILSQPHIRSIFELLSINLRDIIIIDRPMKIKSLEYYEPTFFDGLFASPSLGARQPPLEKATTGIGSPQKPCFISRSQLKTGTSHISNSNEIDALMSQAGFEVIFPEALDINEQVALFDRFDLICGFPTSFFHLKALSSATTPIFCLVPNGKGALHVNFLNIDLALGLGDKFCLLDAEPQPPPENFVRSFSIDIKQVNEFIERVT